MRSKYFKILLSITLFIWATMVAAVSFNATVEDNTVAFGNSIRVKLLLSDAKPLEHIDISAMAKDFNIYTQQQFSAYRNVNGAVQEETGWNVVLMPKKPGKYVIPAISLETDKGRFSTQEIMITVQSAKAGSKKSDSVGISLVSIVSKAKAYINEPIIYTLKIISYKNIANIVLDDIKSNDAIIEKIGEPKQYNQVHGGVNAHIIEIRYAVTALKAGKITILPALMRGELQVPAAQPHRQQRYGVFNNLFLDNLIELKPFSLQSDKISIDILPAPNNSTNWLPVRNLEMSEKWDGLQNAKVGDTITRKIKITAKGAFAKQLPSINDFMQVDHVKAYANKPSFDDSYNEHDNTIIGIREEEYSIVPQQAGSFTLPEVKIKWWNLNSKKFETTTLPAKTIKVAAASTAASPNVTIDYSSGDAEQEVVNAIVDAKPKAPIIIYIVLGALVGVILSLCAVIIYIIKKKPFATSKSQQNPKAKSQKPPGIATVLDLRNSILQYAIKHWGAPKNITLNRLGDALTNNNYTYDLQIYGELCENINAVMYANEDMELSLLITQWEQFKKTVIKTKSSLQEPIAADYSSINPT